MTAHHLSFPTKLGTTWLTESLRHNQEKRENGAPPMKPWRCTKGSGLRTGSPQPLPQGLDQYGSPFHSSSGGEGWGKEALLSSCASHNNKRLQNRIRLSSDLVEFSIDEVPPCVSCVKVNRSTYKQTDLP